MHSKIIANLAILRQNNPVIHNITNQVVMNSTANALLAVGASPVMAHAPQEMEDMMSISSALVINTGTPDTSQIDAMKLAIESANKQGKPWILDPVGAGATAYRLALNSELLKLKPTVIRGNASEILTLLTGKPTGRGVDSEKSSDSTLIYLQEQAEQLDTVLAVTGATDYIADKSRIATIKNGHPLMARVTGTGCTATAITAAFLGSAFLESCSDYWTVTVSGIACLGIAGEQSAAISPGPGSLQMHLLDKLYQLDMEAIEARLDLSIL